MKKSSYKKKKTEIKGKKIIALIVAIVILFCATVAVLVPTVIIPAKKYNEAKAFLDRDKYDKAASIFSELGSFMDSEEQLADIPLEKYKYALRLLKAGDNGRAVQMLLEASETVIKTDEVNEIKHQFAVRLVELKDYHRAAQIYCSLVDYKDSRSSYESVCKMIFSEALVGSTVFMGTYEQDGNVENGPEPLEWMVLAVEDQTLLLTTRYLLDSMPYADSVENNNWENSIIRKWLNADFYNSSFTASEKGCILTSKVDGVVDPELGDSMDFIVKDKIYILSHLEANNNFVSDIAKKTTPLEIVKNEDIYWDGWWLRDHYGAYVTGSGSVNHAIHNAGFIDSEFYVRPAMRISCEK